jgi:NADH/F420H2 dehydrogenase subunit C
MDIRNPVKSNGGDWNQRFGDIWKAQVAELKAKFGAAIEEVRMPPEYPTDLPTIFVKKESVVEVLRFLKTDAQCDYQFLSDLTATDEEVEPRFEVVYHLYSQSKRNRIRVKTRVRENEECPTAIPVWPGANWAEREVWDMFGVKFTGHPDLRRILMDERWKGFPLRKDYPIRGYQVFTDSLPPNPALLD